jgi:hypothetical protein
MVSLAADMHQIPATYIKFQVCAQLQRLNLSGLCWLHMLLSRRYQVAWWCCSWWLQLAHGTTW